MQGRPAVLCDDVAVTELNADLAPNEMRVVEHDGVKYAVVNLDGAFYAFSDACTHLGCDLHEGKIVAHKQIQCPCHGARFDVTTGQALGGPSKLDALKIAKVTVQDGKLVLT
jgi:nitrite reductase/ring-hydroxylating ferredoxin subunit